MSEPSLPEHMDRWSRNRRLYETLKGAGLYVVPVSESDDEARIDYLIVAADLPSFSQSVAENAAQSSIRSTVKGAKVVESVESAEGSGHGVVIDFPAVR